MPSTGSGFPKGELCFSRSRGKKCLSFCWAHPFPKCYCVCHANGSGPWRERALVSQEELRPIEGLGRAGVAVGLVYRGGWSAASSFCENPHKAAHCQLSYLPTQPLFFFSFPPQLAALRQNNEEQ